MQLYAGEKTGIFIDGSNLYAASKALHLEIDFKALISFFQKQSYFYKAFYYTALLDNQENTNIKPLIDWLDYHQYNITTKPAKIYIDEEGNKKIKSSIAIDLCIDALIHSKYIDHYFIFSGDSDYLKLIETLKNKGKKVSILSTITAQQCLVADSIRRTADQFIELSPELSFISSKLRQAI